MKKIIMSICLGVLVLNAVSVKNLLKIYPMDVNYMSVTNGGQLTDIDAYRDGVGFFITNDIDNSDMNENVFKYGEESKNLGLTLKEVVETSVNKDVSEKLKIMDIEVTPEVVTPIVQNAVDCSSGNIGDEYVYNGISYLIVDNYTIKENLDRVVSLCTSHVTDMSNLFSAYNFSFGGSVAENDFDIKLNGNIMLLASLDSMEFNYNPEFFNEPLDHWDVSNVTNMTNMFYGARTFNQDIGSWDVSNVITMDGMFNQAEAFNQDLNSWDVSNVETMRDMFQSAYAFNGNIKNWNTKNVYDMDDMLAGTWVFNHDISNWDVDNVVYNDDFRANSALTEEHSPFREVGAVCNDNDSTTVYDVYTTIQGECKGEINPIYIENGVVKCILGKGLGKTFEYNGETYKVANDEGFKSDIANELYYYKGVKVNYCTSNVTDMSKIFKNSSMNKGSNVNNDLMAKLNTWDTSNVTNMSELFYGAYDFNQPLDKWNTSKVTNMSYMFNDTDQFNQPLNNWDTSKVTNMAGMLANIYYFNQPLNNWNTSKVTNMSGMFANIGLFDQDISNWDTSNVTNMSTMFYGAIYFNQPINNWNTGKVTNMSSMFTATGLFNQQLNNWNTSNVTTMSFMFYQAYSFNQQLYSWNTGKVTDMSSMFREARVFNQYIKDWNVSKVTNSSYFRLGAILATVNSPF